MMISKYSYFSIGRARLKQRNKRSAGSFRPYFSGVTRSGLLKLNWSGSGTPLGALESPLVGRWTRQSPRSPHPCVPLVLVSSPSPCLHGRAFTSLALTIDWPTFPSRLPLPLSRSRRSCRARRPAITQPDVSAEKINGHCPPLGHCSSTASPLLSFLEAPIG